MSFLNIASVADNVYYCEGTGVITVIADDGCQEPNARVFASEMARANHARLESKHARILTHSESVSSDHVSTASLSVRDRDIIFRMLNTPDPKLVRPFLVRRSLERKPCRFILLNKHQYFDYVRSLGGGVIPVKPTNLVISEDSYDVLDEIGYLNLWEFDKLPLLERLQDIGKTTSTGYRPLSQRDLGLLLDYYQSEINRYMQTAKHLCADLKERVSSNSLSLQRAWVLSLAPIDLQVRLYTKGKEMSTPDLKKIIRKRYANAE